MVHNVTVLNVYQQEQEMKEEKGSGAEAESQSQLVAKEDNKGNIGVQKEVFFGSCYFFLSSSKVRRIFDFEKNLNSNKANNRFHLSSQTFRFHPQTQSLQPRCVTHCSTL